MTTACAPEEEGRRLHELRIDEFGDLALAAVALGAAVAATILQPQLVMPLFVGGVAALFLGGRAFFRRLDLVDELLLDSHAYAIPEIRRRAEQAATMESRRALARTVRHKLTPALGCRLHPRTASVEDDLRALADDLENEALTLDPLSAAQCKALLADYGRSPLLNDELQAEDAKSWIRRIRLGFDHRTDTC